MAWHQRESTTAAGWTNNSFRSCCLCLGKPKKALFVQRNYSENRITKPLSGRDRYLSAWVQLQSTYHCLLQRFQDLDIVYILSILRRRENVYSDYYLFLADVSWFAVSERNWQIYCLLRLSTWLLHKTLQVVDWQGHDYFGFMLMRWRTSACTVCSNALFAISEELCWWFFVIYYAPLPGTPG